MAATGHLTPAAVKFSQSVIPNDQKLYNMLYDEVQGDI